jgi:nicotinate-nucleotide adenylyltransferase
MGSDSFQNITKWKNYSQLIRDYTIYVYNRPGFEIKEAVSNNIQILNAPLLEISSTRIRQMIQEKKSISYLVPNVVKEEIEKGNYYQKK